MKRLDTHNMVGIVTLGWVSVVGLTGFIITMTLPITMIWQMDELAEMAAARYRRDHRAGDRPLSLARTAPHPDREARRGTA
ncbi:hypothetical protein [Sphingomonas sp. DT-204]|uniref:hypothetical protein n=1 Tax=Sphingomonas sp. DT-204 TaxID=3396166 RepID=UPI003F1B5DE0